MDPEVLVLDEPTAGLDPEGTATLCTIFERLRDQGRTLILISHDMDLVGRMATEIAVMQEEEFIFKDRRGPCSANRPLLISVDLSRPRPCG